jgi:DNA polymerase (family 10)
MPSAKTQEIADIFYEIADILELKQVAWKPAAYRKAARTLETLSEDVENVITRGGIKALMELPGIGEALALKIEEYIKTGKIKEYGRVKRLIPPGVEEMMHIASLGPKKAMRLYQELHIKSVAKLEQAAKSGKIRKLKGFGEKSEKDILRGLLLLKMRHERALLGTALPLARDIVGRLKRLDYVKAAEYAGSIRRMKETIGDIDILVISPNPKKVMDFFTTMPDVATILAKGSTKSMVMLKQGIQADVRVLEGKSFGAALQYFTGNKDHNIALRTIAIKKGLKLSEYGLFKRSGAYVVGKTEADIYKTLGLQYIEPEIRENQGEIEAARKHSLPKLIELRDIKGDCHMHTGSSDGTATIEEMARAAQALGYQYIVIADHSKSESIANGLDEKRLLKQIIEIDKLNKIFGPKGFRILKGTECDILPNGKLDFSDSILKQLDFVVASIHSRFKSPKDEMTKRICTALENPYVSTFAHPTGRLINERLPYQVDLEKVFEVAKAHGKFVEINAYPNRLDLNDVNIRTAKSFGLKFTIDTDAHAIRHLRNMEFGITQARRGWLEAKDVINTLPLKRFEKLLTK